VSPFLLLSLLLAAQQADLLTQLRSDDPTVQLRAVQDVERLGADGSPDAVYLLPLAKLLADPDPQTRGLAALALSRHISACQGRAPEGLVGPLLRALGDENRHLLAFCGRTLAVLGDRALPEITTWLQASRPRAERLTALKACHPLAANPNVRPAVVALLWGVLADTDEIVRDRAFTLFRILRGEYDLPAVRDPALLAGVLRVNDPRIRTLGALQLAALEADAFPLLADLLDDPSPVVRTEVVRVLERLLERRLEPPEELTPTLVQRLDRAGFASLHGALKRIALTQAPAPEEVVTQVDKFLTSTIEAGQFGRGPSAVKDLLAGVEVDAVKVLTERLVAADPRVRTAAGDVLRYLFRRPDHQPPAPRSLANLALALVSSDLDMAREAALILGDALDPTIPVPAVLSGALRVAVARDDPKLRQACAEALAVCGTQVRETLLFLLDHPDTDLQYYGALAIQRMPGRPGIRIPAEATERLRRLRSSPDPRVREAAGRALLALLATSRAASGVPVRVNRPGAASLAQGFGSREEALQEVTRFLAEDQPGPEFAPALAKLLGDADPVIRALAADDLRQLVVAHPERVPDSLPLVLAVQLEDSELEVREACCLSLEALGKRVAPAMRAALSTGRTREQRLALLRPLVLLLSIPLVPKQISSVYWELLSDHDPIVRDRILTPFAFFDPARLGTSWFYSDEIPLETLAATLRMNEPPIRRLAVEAFRLRLQLRFERIHALSLLLLLLEDDNLHARSEADRLLAAAFADLTPAQRARVLLLVSRRDATEAEKLRSVSWDAVRGARQGVVDFVRDQLAQEDVTLPSEPGATADPTLALSRPLASIPARTDLLAALRSGEEPERLRALQRVERLGSEGVLEAAFVVPLARLLLDPRPGTRILAARALEHHLPALRGKVPDAVVQALLLGQADKDPEIVADCKRTLATQREIPWTLNDLVTFRDATIREAVVILEVAHLLNDRRATLRALTLLGTVLVGPDQECRRAGALAVSLALPRTVRIPSDVLLGLRLGIKSDDPSLRRACVEALAACGQQGEDSLCTLLESGEPQVCRCCAQAIVLMIQRTKYAPRWTVLHLRPLLEARDEDLRKAVQEALTAIERTPEGDRQP
jgi:hypothetical protein